MADESATETPEKQLTPRTLADLAREVQAAPTDPRPATELGHALLRLARPADAEAVFRNVLALSPEAPVAHANHAIALERVGRVDEALAGYRRAVALLPGCPALRLLSELLRKLGRVDEALSVWAAEHERVPYDPLPLRESWRLSLAADRLHDGAAFARENARVRWATRFWPTPLEADPPCALMHPPPTDLVLAGVLKAPKLRHDIEQIGYLRARGVVGPEFDRYVDGMKEALARIGHLDQSKHHHFTERERANFGAIYGRIFHVTPSPRVARALSSEFDMAKIEADYVDNPPGIVFIDKLLSDEALGSLRRYCLESAVWSGTAFERGYLQANFFNGFESPLLLQIAEELRAAMPRVIGDRPLMKMWGFKYDQEMNGIKIHADEAAVNVNFWITPDDANLEPESGGLIVYDAEAPLDWSFKEYNGYQAPEHIDKFLKEANARVVEVPYRQNRAVIFDSDLFHATAPIRFKPGYENRRINVTMLYGDRTDKRIRLEAK